MSSAAAAAPQDLQQFTDALQVTLDTYDLLVERLAVLEDQLSERGVAADREQYPGVYPRGAPRDLPDGPDILAQKIRSSSGLYPSRTSMSGGRASRCGPCTRPSTPSCRRSSRTRPTGPSLATSKPGCGWRPASSSSQTSSSSSSSTRAPATSRSGPSRSTRLRRSSQTPMTPRTLGTISGSGTRRPSTPQPGSRPSSRKKPTTPTGGTTLAAVIPAYIAGIPVRADTPIYHVTVKPARRHAVWRLGTLRGL